MAVIAVANQKGGVSKLTEFIVHQREEQEWGGMEL